ncbi:hypothetical protein QFZ68_007450 [Streptomyces sp. V1I6]|nr:hypothetical protein [Streptomyces sp. V1I6]
MVKYWYKKGDKSRGVGWVYASRGGVNAGSARWLYKKPGGAWKVGAGWKKAKNEGSFVQTHWGRGGHSGPMFPRGTQICTQYKGLSTKACVKLA